MQNVDQLHRRVKQLYEGSEVRSTRVPLAMQAYDWARLATSYIGAASILEQQPPPKFCLPRLQLTGHAMECSLKACLAAADKRPPKYHDLVRLCMAAGGYGFALEDRKLAMIVHLNHFYYQDLGTGSRFKTRYPTQTFERCGGGMPSHSTFVEIVWEVIGHARQRTAVPYREMFDTLQRT